MLESPDAVLLYIPLMKELGMNWGDIKNTPRHELVGLLSANAEYEMFHSMDGITEKSWLVSMVQLQLKLILIQPLVQLELLVVTPLLCQLEHKH